MATAAELAGASAAAVASARAALAAHLASLYPDLAAPAGPLGDLVLGPAADALAAVEVVAAKRAVSFNPEAALAAGGYDAAVLTAVLAGRGVTRKAAAKATGTAALVFSADAAVVVPANHRLKTVDGVYYRPSTAVTAKPSATQTLAAGEVRLAALPGGAGYVALVPVAAESTGAAGNRPAGTALTPVTALTNQTGAYAAADLAGGADLETDAQLLARLPAATAPRGAGTVAGIQGLVQKAAPAVTAVAVLGYGNPGLTRARSALALASPGKADARVRVAGLGRTAVRVTATYQGLSGPYGSWRLTFTGADAPDWVVAERVVQAGANPGTGGYAPTAVTPTFDTSAEASPPDVRTTLDAAFSKYAGAVVTFTDPDTATGSLTAGVSTKTYDLVVRTVPGLTAAQAAVMAPADRPAGGDCLVRAACPVLVTCDAAVTRTPGVTLTAAQAAQAVAAAVNATPISGYLTGAVVAAAAQAALPAGAGVTLTNWVGTVHAADGTTQTVTGDLGLAVATDWARGLGTGTVAYYADPAGINVTLA